MSLIQDFFGLHSSNDLPLKTVSPLSEKIANSRRFKKLERKFILNKPSFKQLSQIFIWDATLFDILDMVE